MRDLDCIKDMKLIAEGIVLFSFLQKHIVSCGNSTEILAWIGFYAEGA